MASKKTKKKTANKPKKEIITAGGQALIEGVMMRSKDRVAMAVRKPNDKISLRKQKFNSITEKFKILGLPFIRGIFFLIEMMVLGIKALNHSANEAMDEEEEEIGIFAIVFTMILAFVFAIALFKFVPLLIAQLLSNISEFVSNNYIVFNIIDGITKIILFLAYLIFISFLEDIQRVFQYHGAEHKAVHCYEQGKKLTIKNVQSFSTLHPRCGTTFILFVLIISIFVYTFIPKDFSFWIKLGLRIALLPAIAGIAYELQKFASKHQHNWLFRIMVMPGLFVQKLTTRRPDDKQVEVAVKALKEVVK
ncbi:DUF1385 domain-containing protein [Nanoarchaeota archaeon]